MLEITADDIALLGDVDLRTLVARLCEAELQIGGLPVIGVTAGGNQDASDGGLDVRVEAPPNSPRVGSIARFPTGFQVKRPDMPRSAILEEMKPRGIIRPVLLELAQRRGAYIIVSSNGSVSDTALANRRKAMRDAVAGMPGADALELDFYDRTRIATWVRAQPGLIPWVRERAGRRISGWQSYGAWAYDPKGENNEYLIDDTLRVHSNQLDRDEGDSALAGISQIRAILQNPGHAVRLVGLSGVGKTRLVQALFDERVGNQHLAPSQVLYTNMNDSPAPPPVALLTDLIAARGPAVVVVDNCTPELHRRLTDTVRAPGSTVSVLTVEYDVQGDEPEGTDVFRLEPSSTSIIQELVRRRFEDVSQVDASTIAEASGGNARIALALAATVKKGESIANLTDTELFTRLFDQRSGPDRSLLASAQACALLYSFQGEDLEEVTGELARLGALTQCSPTQLYADVATLKGRELVQQRSVWRAVLPHAVSNRLAKMALQIFPYSKIDAQLVSGGTDRLRRSFSRRLSYLHDSPEAVRIAENWLVPRAWLGEFADLSHNEKTIFLNIATIAPDSAIAAISRALTSGGDFKAADIENLALLLRAFAWDAARFDRCARLLADCHTISSITATGETSSALTSLFFMYLSGTHATVEQRTTIVDWLLHSEMESVRGLGRQALTNLLEAEHFSSSHSFEFGARSRDFGYSPRTRSEVEHWYRAVLTLISELILEKAPAAEIARSVFAEQLRSLVRGSGLWPDVIKLSETIASSGFWRDGWLAVKQLLYFDKDEMPDNIKARFEELEGHLRPANLDDRVLAYVLGGNAGSFDFEDDDDDEAMSDWEKQNAIVRGLGEELANDTARLDKLLPSLFREQGRQFGFARGLAIASKEPEVLWKSLVDSFVSSGSSYLEPLAGFLSGLIENDPPKADEILDAAVYDPALDHRFPELQSATPINGSAFARLHLCIERGVTSAHSFRPLANRIAAEHNTGKHVRGLIDRIARMPNGQSIAMDFVYAHLFHARSGKKPLDPDILACGRDLLRNLVFEKSIEREDHKYGTIVRACLTTPDSAQVAFKIATDLRSAASQYFVHGFRFRALMSALASVQLAAMLDGLLLGSSREIQQGIGIFQDTARHHRHTLADTEPDQIVSWCQIDSTSRFPVAAAAIVPFHRENDRAPLKWSSAALRILDAAPDVSAVLKAFTSQFRPMSWSGSRSAIMQSRAELLDALFDHSNQTLSKLARDEKEALNHAIELEREYEAKNAREDDERFEQ